jgi:hypothetical protein
MFLLSAGIYTTFEKTAAERLRNLRSRIESQEAHRKHVQVSSCQCALHLGNPGQLDEGPQPWCALHLMVKSAHADGRRRSSTSSSSTLSGPAWCSPASGCSAGWRTSGEVPPLCLHSWPCRPHTGRKSQQVCFPPCSQSKRSFTSVPRVIEEEPVSSLPAGVRISLSSKGHAFIF